MPRPNDPVSMNLETFLTDTTLRLKKEEIADIIGTDSDQYKKLMGIALSGEMPICWRAMWLADYLTELEPHLGEPYVDRLWREMERKHPEGVVRSAIRMLSRYPIPEEHQGFAADLCITLQEKESVPVAIKVHAMEVLFNIAKLYPDLKDEFIAIIQEQVKQNTSTGYMARARRVIPKLEAL